MDIRNFFSGLFPQKPRDVLHTPYGDFNLAKEGDRKRVRKMVIELQRTTDALTRKDIKDWRDAWQMAINVDNPDRQRLYDIYRDVEVDLHLSGCVGQRTGFVMAKSFKIVNGKGDEDGEALHYFDQAWFKQLMRYALEANFWGHSLIELGEPATDGDGCLTYSDVTLIPRKHVIPEYGRVITELGQDWNTGICYREPPFTDWLIEAGRPDSLGLYLKAATQTIPKKNMLAFWDTFGEIFGMPMRIARTTSRDKKEIDRLDRMLREAGASLSMVAGQDTEIEFVESGKGDAYNVYDKRISRANSELSKLVIGQTMTIEDGSSLSQSQTHLEVFQNLVESDCDMLRDIVNNQLIPRMVRHGFPVKGLRFEWDDAVDYTPEQQKAYEEMVLQHYKVNPLYFEDKYGMPCEEKPGPAMLPADDDVPDGKKPGNKKQPSGTLSRFFD
uniref:Portal n=1 Tax=Myoviridae sp. ctt8G1 TaxID=2827713 RepID=A0A8S5TG84_9CAUD|nr:MAG TPA: portal [Myoviridae sp. ctt8G1]